VFDSALPPHAAQNISYITISQEFRPTSNSIRSAVTHGPRVSFLDWRRPLGIRRSLPREAHQRGFGKRNFAARDLRPHAPPMGRRDGGTNSWWFIPFQLTGSDAGHNREASRLLQGAFAEAKRSPSLLAKQRAGRVGGACVNRSLRYYDRAPFHISCAFSSESSWESSCPSLRYR
jgi:hypothetical protein